MVTQRKLLYLKKKMTDNQNVEVGSNDIRQRAGHDLLH